MRALFKILFFLFVIISVADAGDDATQAEHKSQLKVKMAEMMATGDFAGALSEITNVARQYPADLELRADYSELKKIISLRNKFPQETEQEKLLKYGEQLRGYYYKNGLYLLALELETVLVERTTLDSWREKMLETLILLDKDEQAAELLKTVVLPTPRIKSLALVLRARTADPASCSPEYLALKVDTKVSPYCSFDYARILALSGDKGWLDILIFFITNYEGQEYQAIKQMIMAAREFKEQHKNKEFIAVLDHIEALRIKYSDQSVDKHKK